jgi:hypothetical protein
VAKQHVPRRASSGSKVSFGAKKEVSLGRKAGTVAKARLGVPSGNRGTWRHGWGTRASAVTGARVPVWVRVGAHGRWNLPDVSLGSGLAAR